jgi:DNA-binding transcriptional regulator YiaG
MDCGMEAKEVWEEINFTYGEDVILKATLPVWHCSCGFSWTDSRAEMIRTEAVCKHLRVFSSSEIIAIRRDLWGVSQEEFARITGIGVATLKRWELGIVIQNKSMDNYLRLLLYPENEERLRKRSDLYQEQPQ